MNLSYASKSVLESPSLKAEISYLSLATLLGRKYLARNFSTISFQVVMDLGASNESHRYATPLKLNGNSLNLITSSETALILKVEHLC